MITKEVDVIVKKTMFVAFDGQEFEDKTECWKHETEVFGSAVYVLEQHAIKREVGSDLTLLNCSFNGYDMETYFLVRIDNKEVFDAISTLVPTIGLKEEEAKREIAHEIADAMLTKELVLVSIYEDTFVWHGSLTKVTDVLKKEATRLFETKEA